MTKLECLAQDAAFYGSEVPDSVKSSAKERLSPASKRARDAAEDDKEGQMSSKGITTRRHSLNLLVLCI